MKKCYKSMLKNTIFVEVGLLPVLHARGNLYYLRKALFCFSIILNVFVFLLFLNQRICWHHCFRRTKTHITSHALLLKFWKPDCFVSHLKHLSTLIQPKSSVISEAAVKTPLEVLSHNLCYQKHAIPDHFKVLKSLIKQIKNFESRCWG